MNILLKHPNTFKKEERICKREEISYLLSDGKTIKKEEFIIIKYIYIKCKDERTIIPSRKVFIAVPKKKIRKAVVRNKIKRRIREVYRNNKYLFPIKGKKILLIGFLYNSYKIYKYKDIEKKIIESAQEIKI